MDAIFTSKEIDVSLPELQHLSSFSHHAGRPRSTVSDWKQTSVYVFVFTDVVLLAKSHGGKPNAKNQWRLLRDVGLGRILAVTDFSGKYGEIDYPLEAHVLTNTSGYEHLIELEVLPVDIDGLDKNSLPDKPPVLLYLQLPASYPLHWSEARADTPLHAARARWLAAFEQCSSFTLRSLSFPSHSGKYLAHGRDVDLELDTRRSVMSILASGLPLPKSPSLQMEESKYGGFGDLLKQEREERGWWALRFQQVMREMQRQPLHKDTFKIVPQREIYALRQVASSPRPLILATAAHFNRPSAQHSNDL
jgi:hypothetical protein